MSEAAQAPSVQHGDQPSSFRMIRTLGGVATISGLLLFFVYEGTAERIQDNKRRALEAAVFNVLPGAEQRTTFLVTPDGLTPVEGESTEGETVYAGYDASGNLVGVAISAAGQGYQDVIRVLYGYSPEKQCVIGFRVLESKETPGLGDRIGKEPFLDNFEALDATVDGQSLAHAIETVKAGTKEHPWEVDAISGATISSKAVGAMLNESAQRMVPLILNHLDQLKAGT